MSRDEVGEIVNRVEERLKDIGMGRLCTLRPGNQLAKNRIFRTEFIDQFDAQGACFIESAWPDATLDRYVIEEVYPHPVNVSSQRVTARVSITPAKPSPDCAIGQLASD
jgi:hypothetical protein